MSNEVIGYERALACVDMIPDPGASGTIQVSRRDSYCAVTTAGAEGRTLYPPPCALLRVTISLAADGGDLTLTVTNGFNQEGDTVLTLADVGDHVTFESVKIGATSEWRIVTSSGVTGTGLEGAVDATTLSASGATTLNGTLAVNGAVTMGDAIDVALNTTAGTKIGTAVEQKLGFWNVTPVVQPAGAAQADQGAMTTVGSNTGTSAAGLSLIGDTTSVNQAAALMNDLLALQEDIAALDVIVTAIRTALVDTGIMKGAA